MMDGSRFHWADWALYQTARALCGLPASFQVTLAGGPIMRDGERLHPDVALLARVSEQISWWRPASVARQRLWQNRGARIVGGPPNGIATRDLEFDGPSGKLRARHYLSPLADAPLLVFFHGGGFVFGDLDTHDGPCRLLCKHAGVHILAVEYRLAPEHPFPAAVDDARAAFDWAYHHASELGASPTLIGIGGDSAGANLAAVVAQLTAKDGGPAPSIQLLIYPAVARSVTWPTLDLAGADFYFTRESIEWYRRQYVPETQGGLEKPDARIDPLAADDLSGLAPALLITAGFDPLRDEGEAYAAALTAAGNEVVVRRFGNLVHGFFNMVGVSRTCRNAVIEIAEATRVLFTKKG